MRFLDSNVFLHAFLIPQRTLTREEQRIKDAAKAIVKGIEESGEATITAVHLSEVVNIIETGLDPQKSLGFLALVLTSANIIIHPVTAKDYETALPLARENNITASDALDMNSVMS